MTKKIVKIRRKSKDFGLKRHMKYIMIKMVPTNNGTLVRLHKGAG